MDRRSIRALLVAGLATVTLAAPALAGGTTTVRTAQPGAELHLDDLSTKGEYAVAAWQESGISGAKGGMATSPDSGGTFYEWMAINGYEQIRVDSCPAPLYEVAATTELHGGDRRMNLVAHITQRIVEEAGTDYLHPDITCVGAKLIVQAVLVRKNGSTRLIVWTYKPDLTNGAAFGFDLGPASAGSAPAITADDDWVHVAWVSGSQLKVKRFKVGSGPAYALSAKPTQTLDTASGLRDPRVGVHGKRVIVAWQRGASVVARTSTDRGVGFGARQTVLKGDKATAKVALLGSADVRGSTWVVAGGISSEGISVKGSARVSTNNGRTWATIPGSLSFDGLALAALDGPGSDPTLLVAWDQRRGPIDPQEILAQTIPLP